MLQVAWRLGPAMSTASDIGGQSGVCLVSTALPNWSCALALVGFDLEFRASPVNAPVLTPCYVQCCV